jgi:hypothetical protein
VIDVAGDGAACVKIERTRSRDFGDYADNGLYYAEFSAYWHRVADDE